MHQEIRNEPPQWRIFWVSLHSRHLKTSFIKLLNDTHNLSVCSKWFYWLADEGRQHMVLSLIASYMHLSTHGSHWYAKWSSVTSRDHSNPSKWTPKVTLEPSWLSVSSKNSFNLRHLCTVWTLLCVSGDRCLSSRDGLDCVWMKCTFHCSISDMCPVADVET